MSDLLKVKIGDHDYLCKWKPSNIIYEFNLDRFDIATMSQDGVQWVINGGSGGVNLTKGSDFLSINFNSRRRFDLFFNQFNIDRPIIVEMTVDMATSYTCYAGVSSCSVTHSVREFSGFGSWISNMTNQIIYNGYISGGGSGWTRIIGLDIENPIRYKIRRDPLEKSLSLSLNDVDVVDCNSSYYEGDFITFNNGGNLNSTTFKLYKLKIYYET